MSDTEMINPEASRVVGESPVGDKKLRDVADTVGQNSEHIRTIGELFEETTRSYQSKLAVEDESGSFTFEDLAVFSSGVCRLLSENGVEPGDVVGLYIDQSKEAIAAILGILTYGCAFVPLDVNDPGNRLSLVVDDCKPSCILTTAGYRADVESVGAQFRAVDIGAECLSEKLSHHTPANISSDAIACIYYTSGSTGRPKGVCQTHRNLQHFVNEYRDSLSVSDEDRVSMLYSMNFSAANMDIFSSVLSGASLHLFNVKKRGVGELRRWLDATSISVFHTVPSVYRSLLKNVPDEHVFGSIRAIDLGGEPVYASDASLLKRHFRPDVLCLNHLAATEASVISQFQIEPNAEYKDGRVPVGQPSPGVEVQIVRTLEGSVADVGEVGEILIKSRYLSPGYLNRPELNEKVFFQDCDGVRCYHSGDLGYFDKHGCLNYIGRTDSRVKVRGHSVDLSEVESVLYRHPNVENGVVVSQATDIQGKADVLVAHVKSIPGLAVDDVEIRAFLAKHLPAYMLPTFVRIHDTLPITATGKVDRTRLPLVHERTRTLDQSAVAPVTTLEVSLAAIFKEVLRIDTVGVDDSFFDLGGDSLLTEDLLIKVKDLHDIDVSFATFAAAPTISGISELIDRRGNVRSHRQSVLLPIRTEGSSPPLFFVPGGIGNDDVVGATYSGIASYLGRDQPFYGLVADYNDWKGDSPGVRELAAKFVEAVRAERADGPYYLAGACIGGIIAYEMAQQLRESKEEVPVLILINTEVPTKEIRSAVRQNRWIRARRRFKRRTRYVSQRIQYHYGRMRELPWRGRAAYLAGRAGNAVEAGREIGRYNRQLEQRLTTLMSSYTPTPYQGRICVLMTRPLRWSEKINWDQLVLGGLDVFQVVGRAGLSSPEAEAALGQQMRSCLDEVKCQ